MTSDLNIFPRVLVLAGTLFFINCSSRAKPWKVIDRHSLDVKVFETFEWVKNRKLEFLTVDTLMRKELKLYIDNDMRIYDRLDPSYELFKTSINKIDTILSEFKKLSDSIPFNISELKVNNKNIKTEIISKSKLIEKNKIEYYNSIKKINKILKKERKRLVFVNEELESYKITLFKIRYSRSQLDVKLKNFNRISNSAFFRNPNSFYSKEVRKVAKEVEQLYKKLDEYEHFLMNIKNIAVGEIGGLVYMENKGQDEKNFRTRYRADYKKYILYLKKIEKLLESV